MIKHGSVYVAEDSRGKFIKIGFTAMRPRCRVYNLRGSAARFKQLRRAHAPFRMLAHYVADLGEETMLHAKFSKYRVAGEWYSAEAKGEILDFVKERSGLLLNVEVSTRRRCEGRRKDGRQCSNTGERVSSGAYLCGSHDGGEVTRNIKRALEQGRAEAVRRDTDGARDALEKWAKKEG